MSGSQAAQYATKRDSGDAGLLPPTIVMNARLRSIETGAGVAVGETGNTLLEEYPSLTS